MKKSIKCKWKKCSFIFVFYSLYLVLVQLLFYFLTHFFTLMLNKPFLLLSYLIIYFLLILIFFALIFSSLRLVCFLIVWIFVFTPSLLLYCQFVNQLWNINDIDPCESCCFYSVSPGRSRNCQGSRSSPSATRTSWRGDGKDFRPFWTSQFMLFFFFFRLDIVF